MKKITLFDTPYAQAKLNNQMIQSALTFLIKNASAVLIQDFQYKDLENVRLYSTTPICKLFQDIINAGKLSNFVFTNLNSYQSDIPELLSLNDVVVDAKMLATNIPVPTQLQKCWLNLTPILSTKDSYNGQLNITDVTEFASMVVRAALCQSYDDTDMWVNPKLAVSIIESYSLTIAHVLRQAFNLNLDELLFVQTFFAAYYAQLLAGSSGSLKVPPLLMRCPFLGSAQDIIARLEAASEFRENDGQDYLTPIKICKILSKIGPARMKNFTPAQLYRYMSSSSLDSQIMMIAIDYPPYWVYQMLRVVSGYKNPVISNVIKLNGLKTKLNQFALEMSTTSQIISKLSRN